MKHFLLLLFLLPTIAFGQTTAIPEQLEEPGMELPEKQKSFDKSKFSSGLLALPYCEYFEIESGLTEFSNAVTGGNIYDLDTSGVLWSFVKDDHYVMMSYGPQYNAWVPKNPENGDGIMVFYQPVFTNYTGTFDLTIQFDLSSYTDSNLVLSFDYRYQNSDGAFYVKYKGSSNENWQYAYPLIVWPPPPIGTTPGNWYHHSTELVNLNPSDETKIVFEITCNNGEGALAFDNLCLEVIPPPTSIGFLSMPLQPKELLTITDILGRTTHPVPNTLLFYIYDDGSVEKRIQLDR